MPKEIERKFLVGEIPPNLVEYPAVEIVQGYLAIGEDGREIRLREIGSPYALEVVIKKHAEYVQPTSKKYLLNAKAGEGLTREETPDIELTQHQFEALWPFIIGRPIYKTRYKIPYGPYALEVDVYRGELEGLVTTEVEFTSVEASADFEPPAYCIRELTHDPQFKNQALALRAAEIAIKNMSLAK